MELIKEPIAIVTGKEQPFLNHLSHVNSSSQDEAWQNTLREIIATDPRKDSANCEVFIEGMQIPSGYLVEEIAQQIIDPQTNRIKQLPSLNSQHNIAFASLKKNNQLISLYFKEFPTAPGREYLVQQLYLDLIGHGCARSELVKFQIKGMSYPVLIIDSQAGITLQQKLSFDPAAGDVDAKHKSQMYLASLFEMQEDGKSNHYFFYPTLDNKGCPCHKLSKIDLDHAFMPPVTFLQKNPKLQQKVILYTINSWLDENVHPEVIEEWLKLDKKQFFINLIHKLIIRDKFYHNLFCLTNKKKVEQLYSPEQTILIESLLPFKLIDEWIQLSERITKTFETIQFQQQSITHRKFLNEVIPSIFKFYQSGLKKYPHDPLKAFEHTIQDGFIFSTSYRQHTKVGGRDLLLSSLGLLPDIKDIQQRTFNSEILLNRFNDLQEKSNLITLARIELTQFKSNIFINLPTDWCEEVMDLLMENNFAHLSTAQQKYIIESFSKVPLSRLRIEGSPVLDNNLLRLTLEKLPCLQQLRIKNCPNLTRSLFCNYLKDISKHLKYLDRLELLDLPSYHSIGFITIVSKSRLFIHLQNVFYKILKLLRPGIT